MARVVGIDPGTVSVDLCGLDAGRLFLDRSLPTRPALADPAALVDVLRGLGPLDIVVGPSGYGLPLVRAAAATDAELRLAYLAPPGEEGGIGGVRALARALAASGLPVVLTPGVIHLASVPAWRKVNRVDMGTAEKVCAAALAVSEQATRLRRAPEEVSLILLELGGAFTAALAVADGRIVDGLGGSSGPIGAQAVGALDGEVAFLAGMIPKSLLFGGGVRAVAGDEGALTAAVPGTARRRVAWEAYVEGVVKAAAALLVSVPAPAEIVLSGRVALVERVRGELTRRLGALVAAPVHLLSGFATVAKQGAQGAALIADGLAGGPSERLVTALGIRDAYGTALDYLHVIGPDSARRRLGIA